MRIGKWLLKGSLTLILIVLIMAGVLYWKAPVASYSSVRENYKPSDLWIVDRNYYPLESLRLDSQYRSLSWTEVDEISPYFLETLIKTEDKRFYSHFGFDPLAFLNAIYSNITSKNTRGASTITMQLVGILDPNPKKQRRTGLAKIRQVISAIKLEKSWSKKEILEAYTNLVPFKGELRGLHAASLGFFDKKPSGLFADESALLVALLRSPNDSIDRVIRRACLIQIHMAQKSGCEPVKQLGQMTFSRPYRLSRSRNLVPVLSNAVVKNSSQERVHTTLDWKIQTLAMSLLREQLRSLRSQRVKDGAVLVLDTQTGEVLAYVANGGESHSSASQIDGIRMKRQAGSTLKPVVYGTALDWNILKPDSLLEDSPADIAISDGRVYHPRNYDHTFRGLVGMGEALGSSLNVPAVRVLQLVGENRVLEKMSLLGFENLQSEEYYGPSLALGAIDVSLWELAYAYQKMATDNKIFSPSTRKNIFSFLARPEYRRFTFGTDSILTLPFSAAVKTGTSKDMRDNWCVGWTSKYTVAVWVGNFDGGPMWNVSGISGAAPIWRSLMISLHNDMPFQPTEFFPSAEPLENRKLSRIRYPAAGMLVGLDPDIPIDLQKLPIEIENPQKDHKVFLGNKLLGGSKDLLLWPIEKGHFKLELKNALGQSIDEIKFEVR